MVEHRIARLVQLGIRQARYVGRQKTLFQLFMAATVANLTLLASKGNDGSGEGVTSARMLSMLTLTMLSYSLANRYQRPCAPIFRHTRSNHPSRPELRGLAHPPQPFLNMPGSRPDL